MDVIISLTNAAYGVLQASYMDEYAAFVSEIVTSIAPEDGHISPKHVELK